MNLYVIMLKTEPNFQLLERLISDYPQLKNGFTLNEVLKLSILSFNDKKALKEMFGGFYSDVHTPTVNFRYLNNKWEVDEIDVQRGFHERITKVLNHALKEKKYHLGSLVSTKDIELLTFLIKKDNFFWKEINKDFEEKFPDPEPSQSEGNEDETTPLNQDSLKFISNGLQEKIGEVSCFNYEFAKAFLELVNDYHEILLERLFEEK